MKIKVCTKCGKAKKSKVPEQATRISGEKVYKRLEKWIEKNPDNMGHLELSKVKCFDRCSKGPNIYLPESKTYHDRMTKEKLKELRELLKSE